MFDIKKYIIQNAFREKYRYHRYHKMYNMTAYILESKIQEIWEVENGYSVCRFAFFLEKRYECCIASQIDTKKYFNFYLFVLTISPVLRIRHL